MVTRDELAPIEVPTLGLCESVTKPGQLSVADAKEVKLAIVYVQLALLLTVCVAGQVTVGAVASLTVTVNVHDPMLPESSVAKSVTVPEPVIVFPMDG
jgi:hypothetical protein